MNLETKKRGLKFVLLAAGAAGLVGLLMMAFLSKGLGKDVLVISLSAAAASGLAAFVSWQFLMRKRETKFRGAWAGVIAVFFAYPLLSIFMAIFDTSKIGFVEYVMVTTVLSITMTGIFTVPLGGFLGQRIARNFDGEAA